MTTAGRSIGCTIYHRPEIAAKPYALVEWAPSGTVGGTAMVSVVLAASIDEARALLPAYADFMIEPDDDDDPSVIETWL